MPGFVRVTGAAELAFPDYDGNGMFKSLGNALVNPNIGMLFIAMHGKPKRLRVNGRATVRDNDPLLTETVGSQLIVRVTARAIFPNCPRYIPNMRLTEPSIYAPRADHETPEPAWKCFDNFKDCIHPRRPTLGANTLSPKYWCGFSYASRKCAKRGAAIKARRRKKMCRVLAHRDISRRCSNSVAFGTKRTFSEPGLTEPDL